jgi:allantoate deiminase
MFTPADVNRARVQQQLEMLAQIGRQPTGGVTRFTFSDEHMQAAHQVADWMAAAGLDAGFDRWGNLIGRTRQVGNLVLSGSHLDSVPNGGHYDGVLGVIAALEAVTLILEQDVPLNKPLGVISFIEEEGARFHGLMGSKLAVGRMTEPEIAGMQDRAGMRYVDALAAVKFAYPAVEVDYQNGIDAFLELHIEQGKRLETAGVPVGVVTSIAGPSFMQVTITGQADHAGATAYEDRHDSLLAAAEFIVALREMAVRRFASRGHMTVGRIEAQPNVTNVVAGRTVFSVDYRASDWQTVEEMTAGIHDLLRAISARQRVSFETEIIHQTPPVPAADRLRAAYEQGAENAGVAYQHVVSWAAHDAMNMASVCDSAMIFVPCRDGRSHTPEEYARPEDIAAGIAVLANAMAARAR